MDFEKVGLNDAIRKRIEDAISSDEIGSNVLRMKPIKEYLDASDGEDISYDHIK